MDTTTTQESTADRLTRQFYDWEKRGRGWQLFDYPVLPEPPFVPFRGYYLPAPSSDDGRKPTFLSSLAERAFAWLASSPQREEVKDSPEEIEPSEAAATIADYELSHEFQLCLPPTFQSSREAVEQFLLSLAYCTDPIAFEIVGLPDSIIVQFACSDDDVGQMKTQLSAHFPEASVSEQSGFLKASWASVNTREDAAIVDFGLSREFMLPLEVSRKLDPDPLIGVIGALADVRMGEAAVLQAIFQPVKSPWAESAFRSVILPDGSPFFMDARDFAAQTKTKLSRPLYGTVVRIAARSVGGRAWEIARALAGSLSVFSSSDGNELIPLENDGYDLEDHEEDLLTRSSRRSGMLLNSDELLSLAHLPGSSVRIEKFERHAKKTKAAPSLALGNPFVLGENHHLGVGRTVTLNGDQRANHILVTGASGTGKSTLLLNLIIQDLAKGEGLAVLDPHGDLVDRVLERIPKERLADVILLDPSDEEYSIGFNILSAHSNLEKNLLASDLVSVFRRLSTSWGDVMTSLLSNAVLAFLESSRGGTLEDLRRFLIEPGFRAEFLKTVQDPGVVYYWTQVYPLLSGKPQVPVITRLDTFLRPKPIRYMVSQKENRLDFAEIMDSGKILLAKLSQGAIGEENAYLLGTLLVSKFNQLVMGRQARREEERRNFWLYIDEWHHFATPSMAALLSGARKYHLGLVLAHHDLREIESRDSTVLSAALSNAYTRICFRLGDQDARKLEDGFSFFKASDLQSLGRGEAVCRIERADCDFNLNTQLPPDIDRELACTRQDEVIAASRARYAVSRESIEANVSLATKPLPEREPEARLAPRQEVPPPEPPSSPSSEPSSLVPSERLRLRPAEATLGRGGKSHVGLQQKIKAYCSGMGYRATIEQPILDGKGSVDVALEKDQETIACQISVSTPVDQEIMNVKKCLSAGFVYVVLFCEDRKKLGQLRRAAGEEVSEKDSERLRFFSDYDDFVSFIQELVAKAASTETRVNGFRVTRNYVPLANKEDQAVRKQNAYTAGWGPKKKGNGSGT
jgi:hypothetical protein